MSYTEMAPLDHVALLRKELELMNAAARSAKGRSQGKNALIQSLPSRSRYHLLSHIDKDDDKFVDCAITANADYIVTEDSHFTHLKQIPFPQLTVLTIDEFNDTLQSPQP